MRLCFESRNLRMAWVTQLIRQVETPRRRIIVVNLSFFSALAKTNHSRGLTIILDHLAWGLTPAHLSPWIDPDGVPDFVRRGALRTPVFRIVFVATSVTMVSVSKEVMHVTLESNRNSKPTNVHRGSRNNSQEFFLTSQPSFWVKGLSKNPRMVEPSITWGK